MFVTTTTPPAPTESMASASARELRVGAAEGPSVFAFDADALVVTRNGGRIRALDVPLRQVLWAEYAGGVLAIHALARRRKHVSAAFRLVHATGRVLAEDGVRADDWVRALLDAAYAGIQRCRRLRVLVNPAGGQGQSRAAWLRKVEPILRAARCTIDLTYTRGPKHAQEIAQTLPLGAFDAIVCLSGDGTLHEVFNGLAEHARPRAALRVPVVPVPTGSGNGMALNLLGSAAGLDISSAALNAVKGAPMPLDLFSVALGGERHVSFMSQCVGLMADLDLGTEHLRWLGSSRFVLGFLHGVLVNRPCPVRLALAVAQDDKAQMVAALGGAPEALPKRDECSPVSPVSMWSVGDDELDEDEDASLPPLRFAAGDAAGPGWITVDRPLSYVYAGQGPYVSRDLMQFPVSAPNDGLIDVVAQELPSRAEMLQGMDGAEHGAAFWMPTQRYFKAHAYRLTPEHPGALIRLAVDGEAFAFDALTVEVHPGLGRVLSPHGRFAPHFTHRPARK